MCVFFYFLNFNVQTAWCVNKSKIYNWMWIKVHFRLLVKSQDAHTDRKQQRFSLLSGQIMSVDLMLDHIIRLLQHLFGLCRCCIICISLHDHLHSEGGVHAYQYICLSWRYSRMENRVITPHWAACTANTLLIVMYTIFSILPGTETVFNSEGWQLLKVKDPRTSKSHSCNWNFDRRCEFCPQPPAVKWDYD